LAATRGEAATPLNHVERPFDARPRVAERLFLALRDVDVAEKWNASHGYRVPLRSRHLEEPLTEVERVYRVEDDANDDRVPARCYKLERGGSPRRSDMDRRAWFLGWWRHQIDVA